MLPVSLEAKRRVSLIRLGFVHDQPGNRQAQAEHRAFPRRLGGHGATKLGCYAGSQPQAEPSGASELEAGWHARTVISYLEHQLILLLRTADLDRVLGMLERVGDQLVDDDGHIGGLGPADEQRCSA